MEILNEKDVIALIDRFGPSLGYDHTHAPVFPADRSDVCAVSRMVEDGRDYGYNVVYLVWLDEGENEFQEIADTRATKDYVHVDSVNVHGDEVTVTYNSGGSFSGNPWRSSQSRTL